MAKQYVLIGSKVNGVRFAYNSKQNKKSGGSNPQSNSTLYNVVAFDSIGEISFDLDASVTKYPIETGAEISDHVTTHNQNFSLTGYVSNFPNEKYGTSNAIAYTNLGTPYDTENLDTRTKAAYKLLKKIWEERQPIKLVSEFEVHENIILKNISFSMEASTADNIAFKLSFEKVRFSSVGATTMNVKSGAKKKTDGNKNTTNNGKSQKTGTFVGDAKKARANEIKITEDM
jgi:hypothetical protein